jgi:FkbM family methyltransferase
MAEGWKIARRTGRRIARQIAGAMGYDLVKWQKNRSALEPHLKAVLTQLDVNCVIDVGANVGQYAASLRQHGYQGRIVSFEPLDDCFSELAARFADDPQWLGFPFALGGQPGKQEIHQLDGSDLSSFLPPSKHARVQFPEKMKVRRMQTVELKTLDELFPQVVAGIEEPRVFLKLDTQGFDLEVFRGAQGWISQILGLQSELSAIPLYEGMPDYLEALAVYRAAGFEVTGFFPIFSFGKEFVLGEFECVMLRRGLIPRRG